MIKRRGNTLPLAIIFFAILGLNICVYNSTARTDSSQTIIEHTQLEFFVPGERILMQANVSDSAGIAEIRLYFGTSRAKKDLVFTKMKHQAGNSYVGIVPAPSSDTEKIHYCFLAVNYAGDVVKTGLFELQAASNLGFVPTWQGDFKEYGETLTVNKEPSQNASESIAAGIEGFSDSVVVNVVTNKEKFYAATKTQYVPGLATIDGGDVEAVDEAGEVKGEGWTKNQKTGAAVGGVLLLGGGIIAAASGGGGGGGKGCERTIDPTEDTADCGGETASFDVSTNKDSCEWTAVSTVGWVGINSPIGTATGDGSVNYTVSENCDITSRDGTIEIKNADGTTVFKTFTITQPGCCCYDVSPRGIDFPFEGGTDTFTIDTQDVSGCCWNVGGIPDWLTLDSESGCGDETVEVTASENESTSPRNASLAITGTGLTVDVTQEGAPENPSVEDETVTGVGTGGNIDFDPNDGSPGDTVSATVSFTTLPDLGDPWHLKVKVNGESKTFDCDACAGGKTWNLDDLFKYTTGGATNRVRMFVNLETGKVKIYDEEVPLDFN